MTSPLCLVHSGEQYLPGVLLAPKSFRLDCCVIFTGARHKDSIDQLATLLSNLLVFALLGSHLQLITQRTQSACPTSHFSRSGPGRDLLCHIQRFCPEEDSGHDPGEAGSPQETLTRTGASCCCLRSLLGTSKWDSPKRNTESASEVSIGCEPQVEWERPGERGEECGNKQNQNATLFLKH